MVASSSTPLLLLDGKLEVVAASLSFCLVFDIDCTNIEGTSLFKVGDGEWDSPRLLSLLTAIAGGGVEVDAYDFEIETATRGVRQLVLHAHRLQYDGAEGVRVLLAIDDVTDARARDRQRDDLLREKAVLLQELQHRVANSLQIIASVLMQSARRAPEEVRGHLENAHSRVMSVAEVQRQLMLTARDEVELRSYLNQLCLSIGASMIQDPAQLSIVTDIDDAIVKPDVSVSLGLVVTELIINALKHAFPAHRHGTIRVAYRTGVNGWTLSVTDDGCGMPPESAGVKAGLGSSIVQALARQLHAVVKVADAAPGTIVSVRHTALKLVSAEAAEAAADMKPV